MSENTPALAPPPDPAKQLAELEAELEMLQMQQRIEVTRRKVARLKDSGGLPKPIHAVSDMFLQLQEEAEDVKNGVMTDSQARNLLRYRREQIHTVELQLQSDRIHRGKQPARELRFIPQKTEPPSTT